MAISEIKDQYYLYFDIDGYKDFLNGGGDIISFVIHERAGGDLPIFDLVFRTGQVDVIPKINEGTPINCKFGRSAEDSDDMILRIQKYEMKIESTHYMLFNIKGIVGSPKYLKESKIEYWKNRKATDVIKAVAGQHLLYKEHKTGISPSADTQTWIRPNTTSNVFIEKVWRHMYISETDFYVYAINKMGEFILGQYSKITGKKEDWKLDNNSDDAISFRSDYVIRSKSGLTNAIGVYDRERRVHHIEEGTDQAVKTPSKLPVLAGGSLNVSSEDPVFQGRGVLMHENIHANYNKAELNNKSKVILHGTTEIEVRLNINYEPFEIFDLVLFNHVPIDKDQQLDKGFLSGLYVITDIKRYYNEKTFGTTLVLSKDALNNLEGSLK